MSEGWVLRRPSSPAAAAVPLPDDDDLLEEFLGRLPPTPSSLLRASLVCKRWLRLLSDPRFHRRLRARHRTKLPLLGFFAMDISVLRFTPLLDPPDRVPSERLSLPLRRGEHWSFLGCRGGLVLLLNRTRFELTVWDPVTGDQRLVALPPGFDTQDPNLIVRNAALLCDDSKKAFRAVLLRHDSLETDDEPKAFAIAYNSETGVWGSIVSVSIASAIWPDKACVLIGNSPCWLLRGYGPTAVLQFDLDRQSLIVVDIPVDVHTTKYSNFQILRMEDGGLGFAILSDSTIRLWARKADSDGLARWMLQKTIELDKLLSLPMETSWLVIHGYDEDGDRIFIWTSIGVFMVQLRSMQFMNLFKTSFINNYYPYTGFYTTGRSIGSGDAGAETLNST